MTTNIVELADAWHAPDCEIDAGGGCVLHADEKEAWVAGYQAAQAEVERLKTDPYKAGYIDGHHDAHARRDESYRDCPRCSFRHKE